MCQVTNPYHTSLVRIKALLSFEQKRTQKAFRNMVFENLFMNYVDVWNIFKKWNQPSLWLSFIFLSWIIDHSKYRNLFSLSFGTQHNNIPPVPCYIMRMLQDRYWICMSFVVNKSNYASPKLLQSSKIHILLL